MAAAGTVRWTCGLSQSLCCAGQRPNTQAAVSPGREFALVPLLTNTGRPPLPNVAALRRAITRAPRLSETLQLRGSEAAATETRSDVGGFSVAR
jgi:hypothetical protein